MPFCGFLAAECGALESLGLTYVLLDAGATVVEGFGKELWPIIGIGPVRDHRNDAPLAAGGPATLASQGSSSQPGHLGRCPGLVDEGQALRIQLRLGCEPGPARACNVGPLLLCCVRYFF